MARWAEQKLAKQEDPSSNTVDGNNLVFTMPFLPSEGVPGKAIVNGDVKDVLIFKKLNRLF